MTALKAQAKGRRNTSKIILHVGSPESTFQPFWSLLYVYALYGPTVNYHTHHVCMFLVILSPLSSFFGVYCRGFPIESTVVLGISSDDAMGGPAPPRVYLACAPARTRARSPRNVYICTCAGVYIYISIILHPITKGYPNQKNRLAQIQNFLNTYLKGANTCCN